ncbi:hypothetical protein L7F22_041399 [Adiantum nelumboides]|nr:hypothetical protein [Adiantum nelumboides]
MVLQQLQYAGVQEHVVDHEAGVYIEAKLMNVMQPLPAQAELAATSTIAEQREDYDDLNEERLALLIHKDGQRLAMHATMAAKRQKPTMRPNTGRHDQDSNPHRSILGQTQKNTSHLNPNLMPQSMNSSPDFNKNSSNLYPTLMTDGQSSGAPSSWTIPLTYIPKSNNFVVLLQLSGNANVSPTPQSLFIDTKSDITWVQCKPSTLSYIQDDPYYQPDEGAKTFRTIACNDELLDDSLGNGATLILKVSWTPRAQLNISNAAEPALAASTMEDERCHKTSIMLQRLALLSVLAMLLQQLHAGAQEHVADHEAGVYREPKLVNIMQPLAAQAELAAASTIAKQREDDDDFDEKRLAMLIQRDDQRLAMHAAMAAKRQKPTSMRQNAGCHNQDSNPHRSILGKTERNISHLNPNLMPQSMNSSPHLNKNSSNLYPTLMAGGQSSSAPSSWTIPLTYIPKSNNFVVHAQLSGSANVPPTPQSLFIDTGSDLTWVQCKPSTLSYIQDDPYYHPDEGAKTFRTIACDDEYVNGLIFPMSLDP